MRHFARIFIVFMLLFASILHASVGKVSLLKGEAFVQRDIIISKLSNNSALEEKDIITTDKDAQIQIIFEDKTVVTLGSESELRIDEYLNDAQQSRVKFKFNQGSFKTITGHIGKMVPDSFKIETKTAAVGIRGTWIKGKIEADGDTIGCLRGKIFVQSLRGGKVVEVTEGHKTFVGIDEDPSNPSSIGAGDFGNEDFRGKEARKEITSGDYETFGYWENDDYNNLNEDINDRPLFADPNDPNALTPASVISSLTAEYIYNGTVLGSINEVAGQTTISTDGTNTIQLFVNFGTSDVSGSISFKSVTLGTDYTGGNNLSISGSLSGGNGFSGTLSQMSSPLTGSIQGNFYGPNAETTKGNFSSNDNSMMATPTTTSGTFTAVR